MSEHRTENGTRVYVTKDGWNPFDSKAERVAVVLPDGRTGVAYGHPENRADTQVRATDRAVNSRK